VSDSLRRDPLSAISMAACLLELGRCLTSVSVFGIFFGDFFESVGFRCRFLQKPRLSVSVSVFPRSPYVYYVIFKSKHTYVVRQGHNVTLKTR
jgi:hypothetical protein